MRVFQVIKEIPNNDNSLKTKKGARISKLELNLDKQVKDIFTFS
jgi:hypothetical protein